MRFEGSVLQGRPIGGDLAGALLGRWDLDAAERGLPHRSGSYGTNVDWTVSTSQPRALAFPTTFALDGSLRMTMQGKNCVISRVSDVSVDREHVLTVYQHHERLRKPSLWPGRSIALLGAVYCAWIYPFPGQPRTSMLSYLLLGLSWFGWECARERPAVARPDEEYARQRLGMASIVLIMVIYIVMG